MRPLTLKVLVAALATMLCIFAGPGRARSADEKDVAAWWDALQGEEAIAARALLKLSAQPREAVSFLKGKLRPLPIDMDRVNKLIAYMESIKDEVYKPTCDET